MVVVVVCVCVMSEVERNSRGNGKRQEFCLLLKLSLDTRITASNLYKSNTYSIPQKANALKSTCIKQEPVTSKHILTIP